MLPSPPLCSDQSPRDPEHRHGPGAGNACGVCCDTDGIPARRLKTFLNIQILADLRTDKCQVDDLIGRVRQPGQRHRQRRLWRWWTLLSGKWLGQRTQITRRGRSTGEYATLGDIASDYTGRHCAKILPARHNWAGNGARVTPGQPLEDLNELRRFADVELHVDQTDDLRQSLQRVRADIQHARVFVQRHQHAKAGPHARRDGCHRGVQFHPGPVRPHG